MQIHEIKNPNKRKSLKKIGRGGKRGTYSGKGQKGQKSRSGHKIRKAERDIIQRLPKLRGIKNKSHKEEVIAISITRLEEIGKKQKITKELLYEKGIVRKKFSRIKIVGLPKEVAPYTIEGVPVSKKLKEKIESMGGKVS